MSAFLNNYLEPFSYFIYLLAVVIHYRRLNRRGGKFLIIYYCLALLLMLAAIFLMGRKGQGNNIWLYSLNSMCTVFFIGAYFFQTLQSPLKKKAVGILVLTNVVYALVKNIVFREFYLFDSVGASLVSASVVVYVFMYFHQVLKNVTEHNILRQFTFWLSSGYLIYFLGSFIIFLSYYYFTNKILATYTHEERVLLTALWGLHNLLLFVSACSLLIGSLWLTYRKRSV